jgi:hypothetical protein
MKKTQTSSPLHRIKADYQPSNYYCVKVVNGYFNIDRFYEGPVVDRVKHLDFDSTKGNVITRILMKEICSHCPHCGHSEVIKREFILFYTKDTIIHNFWKNVKLYSL